MGKGQVWSMAGSVALLATGTALGVAAGAARAQDFGAAAAMPDPVPIAAPAAGSAMAADAALTALPREPVDGKVPLRLDLTQAIVLTLRRHPDIAKASAQLARGRADLGTAKAAWAPQLSYQANLGPHMLSNDNTSNFNENVSGPTIYLQQQLYDFGRSKGEIDAARSTTRQRWYEREATADQLAAEAAQAFLEVKRYELLSVAADHQVGEVQRLRELIALRVNAGIADKSDLMLADVRTEGTRGDAIQARTSLAVTQAQLANLVGGTPVSYDDPAAAIAHLDSGADEPDYDALPSVAATHEAERAAVAKVGEVRAERWPKLGVQVGYTRNNYTYSSQNNALTAFVTVSGDFYKRSNHYLEDAAQDDRRAAEATKDAAVLDAQGQVRSAVQEIRAGQARIDAYVRQEQQAETATRIFIEEYKLGKRTLSDLLNTQLEVYRAASSRIVAEYDIMEARVKLAAVSGSLRDALGLPATLGDAREGEDGGG